MKINLPPIQGGFASVTGINERLQQIEEAIENTVSRDGSLPNSMEADLDMHSNSLINIKTLKAKNVNADKGTFNTLSAGGQQFVPINSIMQDDRHTIFVGEFGAAGNGVTDDTVAVQEAINYAAERGLTLVFDGTYLVGELDYPDNIDWLGKNSATFLYNAPSADPLRNWIEPTNDGFNGTEYYTGSIRNLTFDYQSHFFNRHTFLLIGGNGWLFENVHFLNAHTRASIRGNLEEATFQAGVIIGNFKFNNVIFESTNGGGITYQVYPTLASGPMLVENVTFEKCVFKCGHNALALINPKANVAPAPDWAAEVDAGTNWVRSFKNVIVNNCLFDQEGKTGTAGPIPIEMWGHKNLTITNNIVLNSTRGIGVSSSKQVVISNNHIENQDRYACEIATAVENLVGFNSANDIFIFSNNTVVNCKKMVEIGTGLLTNAVISNNIHDGTYLGMSTYEANTHSISAQIPVPGNQSQKEAGYNLRHSVIIENNLFKNLKWITSCIRLVGFKDVNINNNTFISSAEEDAVCFVLATFADGDAPAARQSRWKINNNIVFIDKNNPADFPQTGFVFHFTGGDQNEDHSFVGNIINSAATVTDLSSQGFRLTGFGAWTSAQDYNNFIVKDNILRGLFHRFYELPADNTGTSLFIDNINSQGSETSSSIMNW